MVVTRAQGVAADLRESSEEELSARARRIALSLSPQDAELAEFLAVASEAARRDLGLEPYSVQLLAAASMLRGTVVDMATGEGKTLVGFLVTAGLARSGRRVHLLSANDYLAGRDAANGSALFSRFGLSCAAVVDGMSTAERERAYRADVVYTTVHQVGFDLLRDRLRTPKTPRVVPELDAVVVDEIDAVLIDDAMVPLVLAGDADADDDGAKLAKIIERLVEGDDYESGGDGRTVAFTETGAALVEESLGVDNLYAEDNVELLTRANVALHAHALITRDKHYIVADGEVRLVNDARGRVAERQRWPDGLQSAVEHKEGLQVSMQAEILDQILVETVAREYSLITGMSGTAVEAAERLAEDLELKTGVVPTNRPCVRDDQPDQLFLTAAQRDDAAAATVSAAHSSGRPVLVGTSSVEQSEQFAQLLAAQGVTATVLNAKNDAEEAGIIAQAGQHGAVTVSTQMAGRGVDIQLGDGVTELGGLLVIGIGRYNSARLDRQLRGRAGRQGDPGASVFFTSLEDPVVTEQLSPNRLPHAVTDDGLVEDPEFHRLYEHAQRVAEGKLLELHRTTRKYQTITDHHRAALLQTRERILTDPTAIDQYLTLVWPDHPEHVQLWAGSERRELATDVALFFLDRAWADHLNLLAETREGIHLRALGRQNPLDEFNRIAIGDFENLASHALSSVRDTLAQAPDDATDLVALGLRRPSSTWTYIVTDNPFGSEADRLVAFIGKTIRGNRPPNITYH